MLVTGLRTGGRRTHTKGRDCIFSIFETGPTLHLALALVVKDIGPPGLILDIVLQVVLEPCPIGQKLCLARDD